VREYCEVKKYRARRFPREKGQSVVDCLLRAEIELSEAGRLAGGITPVDIIDRISRMHHQITGLVVRVEDACGGADLMRMSKVLIQPPLIS
jgi:hypothetical protein